MDKNKIKIFTHTDFDGVSSPEVFKRLMNKKHDREFEYEIEYCDTGKYGNIDSKIVDFLGSIHKESEYYGMYIMDLAPTSKELAMDIILAADNLNMDFACYDHHKTAEFLNDIDSRFIIKVEINGKKMSGTSLIYHELVDDNTGLFSIWAFSEIVRSYDTWDWHNDPSDMFKFKATSWNDLLWMIGRDRFVNRITDSLNLNFTEAESLLLDLELEKKERYIKTKLDIAQFDSIYNGEISEFDMHFALVDGEQYHSELGNKMCLDLIHPGTNKLIDFAVIRNGQKLSFRSVKGHINCSEIAKLFNGGGHARAAGGKGQQWPIGY